MESYNHEVLKEKAIQWLWESKDCRYIATEIKIGRYIFDVVGSDGSRVYIIEAKQALADYKRECNDPKDIRKNIKLFREEFHDTGDKKLYLERISKERDKGIKFYDDSLLKLSSARYIIAPDGMITNVPFNWGLINEEPRQIEGCKNGKINKSMSEKVVRYICRKNTKKYLESIGVVFEKNVQWSKKDIV